MKYSAFSLCLTLLVFSSLPGSPLAPWLNLPVGLGPDPVVLPSGDGKNQAEPHVIRSLTDPDLILATFQDGRFSDGGAWGNGYAVSEDGGFTWRRSLNPRLTQLDGGPYFRATDPVGGISHDGILYLNSLVAMDAGFNQGRVVMQRSLDRGQSWEDPVNIYTGYFRNGSDTIFPDKNWMVVDDYPDSPHRGRILVSWTNFRTIIEGSDNIEDFLITTSYSDTQGRSWSPATYATPPSSPSNSVLQYQGSQPLFLPGGALAIVYHNFLATRLEVIYSADGGASYPYPSTRVHDRYYMYDLPNFRDGSFLPSAAVARETGDLFISYTSRASQGSARPYIYFVRSRRPDPGAAPASVPDWNFSEPVQVSSSSPSREVVNPTIAVSPDGLEVTIYFYDTRHDGGMNSHGDFYAVQSGDGGVTWTEPFRLSPETFDIRKATNTGRGYMIGDYFGLAAPKGPDQAAVAVWVDTVGVSADPRAIRIGSPEKGVFNGWLQANLPYAARPGEPADLRLDDADGDRTPNLLEYVLGLSPQAFSVLPELENGLLLRRLADGSDPELQVRMQAGAGAWPHAQAAVVSPTSDNPYGEGYWNEVQWSTGQPIDHVECILNDTERWFLLESSAVLRWVRAFPDGWVWSPWFGYLNSLNAPWIYHQSLGWLYEQRLSGGGIFYSAALGAYIFADPDLYPWIVTTEGRYYYILEGAPWIYDATNGEWLKTI